MDLIDQLLSVDRSTKCQIAWIFWGRSRLQLLRSFSKQLDTSQIIIDELRYEAYHLGYSIPNGITSEEALAYLDKLYADESIDLPTAQKRSTMADLLVLQLRRRMIEASANEVSSFVTPSTVHKYKMPLEPFGWLQFKINAKIDETVFEDYLLLCRARARLKYAFLRILPIDGVRWELISTKEEAKFVLESTDLYTLCSNAVENHSKLSNKLLTILRDRLALMKMAMSDLPDEDRIGVALKLLRLTD